MFDPSLKKKKKKKKTFDLDGAMEAQTENAGENAEAGEEKDIGANEEDVDLESFGKKKKKKKKVVDFEGEEKGAEDAGEKEIAGEGIYMFSFPNYHCILASPIFLGMCLILLLYFQRSKYAKP